MTREDVLKVVTHTGDCYRIKTKHEPSPFNFYVSQVGQGVLIQSGSGLDYRVVSYHSIEWVERY
jgi:hypothetical protein